MRWAFCLLLVENAGARMSWQGPHKIGDYLATVVHSPWQRPPEAAGVYLVSEKPWRGLPTEADRILYVSQAAYLRYQIGRLLCDLLGFTGDDPSPREPTNTRAAILYGHTIVCLIKLSRSDYILPGVRNASVSRVRKPLWAK